MNKKYLHAYDFLSVYLPLVVCSLFLLFSPVVSAQSKAFRGMVHVKTFKVDNHLSKSPAAKMISKNHDIPIAELDTIYRTHYICGDTMAIYFTGVDGIYQSSELQTDTATYLYNEKAQNYLQMRLLPRALSSIKAKDWKPYKRRATANPFDLNYKMIHPRFKTTTYLAKVDPSVIYPESQQTQGQFSYIFHPFGKIETLVQKMDTREFITFYNYEEDSTLTCQSHFSDLDFRALGEDPTKFLGPKTSMELIPAQERMSLPMNEVRDTNGRGPSLDDYAGKLVYVDLWASWCAPCRREMPFIQELRERYPAEKLAIISISIDKEDDLENWRKAMNKFEMKWDNWIIYDGFKSDFAERHNLKAIPRYLLLDEEGRIMNDNAPRPSDEQLNLLLDKLLK